MDRCTAARPCPGVQTLLVVLLTFGLPGLAGFGSLSPMPLHAQQESQAASSELGVVDFPVSCDAGVREDFERGLALMHHMMYEESRAVFQGLVEAHPDCAMARWGVAMTLFQPLWPARPTADDLERGRHLVSEAARAAEAGGAGAAERALIDAAAAFYRDPGTGGWWTRIERWAEAMEAARGAHPGHREIRALWALSRLAVADRTEDPAAARAAAAAELRSIWEEEPRHPGAVHYTIHANDVPERAGQDPEIVGSYRAIAPEVPHALHMPTHIYVRTGNWPEVIRWNRRSADASLRFPAGERTSHHYIHAADYLVYAYLQQGDDQSARQVLREVGRHGPHQPTFIAAYHLSAIPARLAVEGRRWDEASSLAPRDAGGLDWDQFPWPEGLTWTASGLGAVHRGDLAAAREAEARLAVLRDRATAMEEVQFAEYLEIDRLVVEAHLARAEGLDDEAIALLREAVALESRTVKNPVSPGTLIPPGEALGEMLLDLGRPGEALPAFEASLERWPGRYRSLLGAARAADQAGAKEEAIRKYRDLLERAGDSEREGVEEARTYLAGG